MAKSRGATFIRALWLSQSCHQLTFSSICRQSLPEVTGGGKHHTAAVLMVPEPFRKHPASSRGSDTQDNSCGWALLLHSAGTIQSCQSKGRLSWPAWQLLQAHTTAGVDKLLFSHAGQCKAAHCSAMTMPPIVLQSSRALWHPKREISSAMAIPKGQFSLFPGGKWGTPYPPILQTPGPVSAALSTATAMETVVMMVLRQAGVFATFITKKIHMTWFPQELLTSKRQFCSQIYFWGIQAMEMQ